MSTDYYKIKSYYDSGRWSKGRVWDAASNGVITPAEYKRITGEPFDEREVEATKDDLESALEELGL